MKPVPFDYIAADSLDAALAALARCGGEAKVLAGGQSLVPMLNFRLLRPSVLVDINRVPGLAFVAADPTRVSVGALTRHHALETSPVIAAHLPVVYAAMPHVAHLAIRNRGTIGGSLAHADPAAELPLMAVLLDAEIAIASPRGQRRLGAGDFFRGVMTTGLGAEEIITDVAFPRLAPHTGWAYEAMARRRGDFALAGVAVTLAVHEGRVAAPRVALSGVGDRPLRATAAEQVLSGRALAAPVIEEAVAAIRAGVAPSTDLHASADYRRHLIGALAGRALAAAWRRALGAAS
jgi:carbon-monoxide dehydrogenase medium subunit